MKHIKHNIGYYILAILILGIWIDWQEQELWAFWLVIPVVFWKLPPFEWGKRLFSWAATKDPFGTKRATKNFMDKRGNKWYWWFGYSIIVWIIASILVSLISGEPTLVLIG